MVAEAKDTGLSSSIPNGSSAKPDSEVKNRAGIARYTQFWNKDSAQDSETQNQNRLDQYQTVTNAYYDGATDLYEYGWGKVNLFHCLRL